MINLLNGDNLQLLKTLEDNSIDSVVTDPPYGLNFMNKHWDYQVPSIEFWKEVYRVLKPGGHILSFGGTRTYHRMVVNIEDAAFEIRDQLQWIYGSGFPKSLNIGKAVDKIQGNEREIIGENPNSRPNKVGDQPNTMSGKFIWDKLSKGTSPYEGWGTGLKPANEPICLARKPISEKTVALNVLKWGTGGINVDGCRIGDERKPIFIKENQRKGDVFNVGSKRTGEYNNQGRFPSNLLIDEEAAEILDSQSGVSKSTKGILTREYLETPSNIFGNENGYGGNFNDENTYSDSGGASRFFYIAKVSKSERNNGLEGFDSFNVKDGRKALVDNPFQRGETLRTNTHPTVKPIKLMTYLCRLITPKDGIVLDPFMGSGSTGMAAKYEGFEFVGMEMDEDYFKIAESRIKNYKN